MLAIAVRAKSPGEREVVQGSGMDPEAILAGEHRLMERKYFKIGFSSFNGEAIDTSEAVEQARSL